MTHAEVIESKTLQNGTEAQIIEIYEDSGDDDCDDGGDTSFELNVNDVAVEVGDYDVILKQFETLK